VLLLLVESGGTFLKPGLLYGSIDITVSGCIIMLDRRFTEMAKFISQRCGNEDLHFSFATAVHCSAHKGLMIINKCF
jgi:hypothetical protein